MMEWRGASGLGRWTLWTALTGCDWNLICWAWNGQLSPM